MTIVSAGPFWVPPPYQSAGSVPAVSNAFIFNAGSQRCGFVLRAPKTGNIRKVGVLIGTVVTTPTNTDVRIETVSAQAPSGSLWGTNTNGTMASGSIVVNTFVQTTLTADAAVTLNDLIGIALVPTGTPSYRLGGFSGTVAAQMPYQVGVAGTPTAGIPVFTLEYDDGSYAVIPYVIPLASITTDTFNSGSNPEIIGMKFKFANAPVRVSGGWFAVDLDNSMDIVLYDSDGTTPLQTCALTNAGRETTGGTLPYHFRFPAPQALLANTFYYLAAKPGASNISIYSYNVNTAAALDQVEGGQNFHYVTFHTNAWTPTTTRRPFMGLEIDGIDDGTPAPQVLIVG